MADRRSDKGHYAPGEIELIMKKNRKSEAGFSLLELMVSMIIMIALMAIVSVVLGKSLGIRSRESRKTDALTSAQAALNIMSREISNGGFGIYDSAVTHQANNGMIIADCNSARIHFRNNINNTGSRFLPPGSTVLSTNRSEER